jgi:dolichyl-phosphate-mannose-protein mannosyltransferase
LGRNGCAPGSDPAGHGLACGQYSPVARLRVVPPWFWLIGLVALSTALRSWAAGRIPIPWILPDELIYAELGKSLYESGELAVLGEPVRFYGLVTPALAGLPLSLDDVSDGYRLLKVLQALVMSLAAVPVYLWARTLATPVWALAAAVLTLAIPDLAYSGLIMTEVAFYPAVVLAAWAMAEALVRPTLGRQALVVGAILLAAATRLQAVVLIPAFLLALLVHLAWERRLRRSLRYWPAAAAFGIAVAAWTVVRLREGPAAELLGAYRAAAEVDYGVRDALRFVLYHAGDVVLFTGLIPVCAVVLLALARDRSERVRAYVVVTAAVSVTMTVLVAVFASRHVGHLAERNLFALAPLFFVGLAAWLSRGAPRPRRATPAVALAALALLVALPVADLVSVATIVDGFTLIPLYRLAVRAPDVDLDLVVTIAGSVAAAAFVLVPRRHVWLLPAALALGFGAASVSASRVVAARATLGQPGSVGANPSWVDRAGAEDTAYLYTGDGLLEPERAPRLRPARGAGARAAAPGLGRAVRGRAARGQDRGRDAGALRRRIRLAALLRRARGQCREQHLAVAARPAGQARPVEAERSLRRHLRQPRTPRRLRLSRRKAPASTRRRRTARDRAAAERRALSANDPTSRFAACALRPGESAAGGGSSALLVRPPVRRARAGLEDAVRASRLTEAAHRGD